MSELKFNKFDYKVNLLEQRELFKDCFPETDGQAIQGKEHYLWKFHSFPTEVDKSWEYAAYIDNEMVSYYAAIPYKYKIGTRTTSIGMVCDVMTSSHHRGKGVFTKMGSFATSELAKHVPFTMGYPIRKAVIPGHLKVGWKIAFELPLYMKFLKTDSFLKSRNIGFLSFIINPVLSVYNMIIKQSVSKHYSCVIRDEIKDIKSYDDLVSKWMNEVPNALDKKGAFAVWRYSAPKRNYRFIECFDKHKGMVGFMACRYIVRENVPSLCIMDFMVLKEHMDCIGLMNKKIIEDAKLKKAEAIMTMMSRHSASSYRLCQNGFLKSPFNFSLIIKKLDNRFSDEELLDEKNWHLMWVDSDDL